MTINFSKYHGAGNDFIIIDNRLNQIKLSENQISFLCNRRFGIGADGLMLLYNEENFDFRMQYFNSDGKEGTMCGNGGRCISAFAKHIGINKSSFHFIAIDGEHKSKINSSTNHEMNISLEMKNIELVKHFKNFSLLDTGSPHYVQFTENVNDIDVNKIGKKIRYSSKFAKNGGVNVNFVQANSDGLHIRTYERGVEEETLACGTGATAAAITYDSLNENANNEITIFALGGKLNVSFERFKNGYKNIILTGPAQLVFSGLISID